MEKISLCVFSGFNSKRVQTSSHDSTIQSWHVCSLGLSFQISVLISLGFILATTGKIVNIYGFWWSPIISLLCLCNTVHLIVGVVLLLAGSTTPTRIRIRTSFARCIQCLQCHGIVPYASARGHCSCGSGGGFNFQFNVAIFKSFNLWLFFQSQRQRQSHLRTGGLREDLDFGTRTMYFRRHVLVH